jgi:hypothetical protein
MSLLDEKEIETLENLEILLSNWNVKYALIGAYALRALGYNVEKGKHTNVIVDIATLPWTVKEAKHEVFPPHDSVYLKDYLEFIDKGVSLHLIPYTSERFKKLSILEYELPNKRKIKIGKPSDSVKMFAEEMKQYKIEEIGEYKIREWLGKIEYWKEVAEKHKDKEFAESCKQALFEVKTYFGFQ